MKKLINWVAGLTAAALLCVALVSPSYAQTTVFVSGGGMDTNTCTFAAPCRTIAHALAFIVANGDTISCLDAGPYGESSVLTITGSFTLDCRGLVYAAPGAFGFNVQVGGSAIITFRHVNFSGSAGAVGAVQILGGNVVFEDCTFQRFNASPGEAIQFAPTVAGAHLTITDSVFTNNGTAGSGGGVIIQPSGGITAGAVIERTQLAGNTYGIVANGFAGGTALVEVRYSSIANSIFDGVWAVTQGTTASVVVEHSASIRNGGSGANAQGAGAYVSLSDSTAAWNATGLTTSGGGLILSYKNNIIAGNLSPGVAPTSFSLQ
jgi:hypothetical protein